MSMKDFDKLEEKIGRLVSSMKHLQEENHKLKKQLQEVQKDHSQKDEERSEVKKKIQSLVQLLDSLEADAKNV